MKSKWKVYTDTGDWIVEAYSASGAEREVMLRTYGRARIIAGLTSRA